MALQTKVGWILSGPVERRDTTVAFVSTHALRTDSYPLHQSLDDQLKWFWDLNHWESRRTRSQCTRNSPSGSPSMDRGTK